MKSEEFVKNFYNEKQNILESYLQNQDSLVHRKIANLDLSANKRDKVNEILDDVLNDVFYSILLGLSGGASIGNTQIDYKIFDEDNNQIDSLELEEHAWSYFQN